MSEENSIDQKFLRWGNPVLWGIGFTGLLIFGFSWVMLLEDCVPTGCETKWSKLLASDPNEIGDTLAGLAGSLAFLWIIVTVILQSQELREQRREFEKMRKAQEAQADLMEKHAVILEDERCYREEARQMAMLDGLLVNLVNKCDLLSKVSYWDFPAGSLGENVERIDAQADNANVERLFAFAQNGFGSTDDRVFAHAEWTLVVMLIFTDKDRPSQCTKQPTRKFVEPIVDIIADIETFGEKLNGAQKLRLIALSLDNMREHLEKLLRLDIWADERKGGVAS